MKLLVCFSVKEKQNKKPSGYRGTCLGPWVSERQRLRVSLEFKAGLANKLNCMWKTETKPTKTYQQMEKWGVHHDYKSYSRNVSLPSKFHMCLRTIGVHRNCMRKETLHRTGAETGRNVSLLFSTCDLICMSGGCELPFCALGEKKDKNRNNNSMKLKWFWVLEKSAITEPQSL